MTKNELFINDKDCIKMLLVFRVNKNKNASEVQFYELNGDGPFSPSSWFGRILVRYFWPTKYFDVSIKKRD